MKCTLRSGPVPWFFETASSGLLIVVLLFSVSASLAGGQSGSGEGRELKTLERLTSRWLELRAELSTARKEWKERRGLLEDRLGMLQDRKKTLQERLSVRRKEASEGREELARARRKLEECASAVESLRRPADRAQRNLEKIRAGLPPLLKEKAGAPESFSGSGADSDGVERRLQRIFGLYGNLARLAGRATIGGAIITGPAGDRREADVLYLGRARGFALLPDGSTAAVGNSARDGWVWEWGRVESSLVKHAIACRRNEKPASFVVLPLRAKGGTQ